MAKGIRTQFHNFRSFDLNGKIHVVVGAAMTAGFTAAVAATVGGYVDADAVALPLAGAVLMANETFDEWRGAAQRVRLRAPSRDPS
jgi:hypothetical protein